MSRLMLVALAAALLSSYATASFGCGYHDPSQVATGILNWTYPKALYVKSAVWRAELSGVIPPREANAPRDLFALPRTKAHLQKLAEHVNQRQPSTDQSLAFSVVLIDSLMWTRFRRDSGSTALSALVHVDGPDTGDVVLVSHSKVVSQLVAGTLAAEEAHAHGMIRYYGVDGEVASVRKILESSLSGSRTVAGELSN